MTDQTPLIDQGNGKLAITSTEIAAGIINSPATGRKIALTFRTSSTTLTVLMDKAEAEEWARIIQTVAEQFSPSLETAQGGERTPGGLYRG